VGRGIGNAPTRERATRHRLVVGDNASRSFVIDEQGAGATIRWILPHPDIVPETTGYLRRDELDSELLGPMGTTERAVKRIVDILLALVLLVLAIPVLITAAIAIKLDSPGPVIFRDVRVGLGRRTFWCYKLRTMRVAEDDEAHREYVAAMIRCHAVPENGLFKRASNPRVTPVGHVLRRFSIDELPQLWNVLKGEMSMVGPRPPVLAEAAIYTEREWRRLGMKPGLTGLAQLRGRSGLRFDLIVASDIEYACRWSPMLDLKILARTPLAVLSGRGAV
jgi:lipopolysaccharide/colanic/teichoic acid biosynthesis glycosyltransferase